MLEAILYILPVGCPEGRGIKVCVPARAKRRPPPNITRATIASANKVENFFARLKKQFEVL